MAAPTRPLASSLRVLVHVFVLAFAACSDEPAGPITGTTAPSTTSGGASSTSGSSGATGASTQGASTSSTTGAPTGGFTATSGTSGSAGGPGSSTTGAPATTGVTTTGGSTTGAASGGTTTTGGSGATVGQGDAGPVEAGTDAQPGGEDAGADADAGAPKDDDLCDVGVWDGTTPTPLTLRGDTFAHDPTMIEADGTFYRFWTGDHIPMATSTDLTTWRNGPSVYRGSYPGWVDPWLRGVRGQTFNFPWAPDVVFFHGQYHLYSSFSARFGANISCITHLTTTDIASGDWTDHGPVVCTDGSQDYNAIDADVALDEDGTPWLSFGSFWGGLMIMKLNAQGDSADGEITRIAWAREIEAPVLLRRCGWYYLFVTWGLCCPGEGRSVSDLSYRVAVGRSKSIVGPYVDRDGRALLEGGGTLLLEGNAEFAAAGHSDVIVTGDKIYHFYHGYRNPRGNAELRIVELPFDDEGWPVAGGP